MTITFTLRKEELDLNFLEKIKGLISSDQLTISVESHDETEYLTRSAKNYKMLKNSIRNVEKGIALTEVSAEEIEKMIYENNSI
ncbi:MAG: hypothetical protein GX121_06595 [Ignavibacteria bacterium]|nr:hypothetical protein [Ignavibacteria bacterium]